MKQIVALYESWQMECCGTDFSNMDNIKQFGTDGSNINCPIKTDQVDYYYKAHSSDYKKLYVLEGKAKKQYGLFGLCCVA